jgi:hypothetical protein
MHTNRAISPVCFLILAISPQSAYIPVMKSLSFIAAISLLLLVGCGEKNSSPSNSGGNPLNAPGDYLNAAGQGQQHAVKTVDTAALNQAIQLFQVDKGRFPKDLNELVTEKFIPKIPEAPAGMKITYDAATGTVKVVKE